MEVEICPSCRSNALSIRRQQADENRCIQRIECDQCNFHMEEQWIAAKLTFNLSDPNYRRRHSGRQNGCSNLLIAVTVLYGGEGRRFCPLNSHQLDDFLE